MWRWLMVSVALLALLLSGCAQAAQKAVEQTTGVKTDQKGDAVTITSKEGTAVTFTSNMPEELKDFPVPDGFKFDSSGSMSSGEDKLAAANWKGKSDYKTVSDYYKKAMADKGYKEDFTVDTDTGGMRNYSKGDISLTVTFDREKGQDEMTISVLLGKSKRTPTPPPTKEAEATDTPEIPEATPTAGPTETPEPPAAADASSLAPELKDVPVPSGFTLLKDGTMRIAQGGSFKSATARYLGKASVKEAGQFYKSAMAGKGWDETQFMEIEDGVVGAYTSAQDKTLSLMISVSKGDAGTEVTMVLTKNE